MDAFEILKDKSIKKLEARKLIIDLINSGSFSSDDFFDRADELNEKQTATFLEAVESITGQKESCLGIEYLRFAERYILSANNSCKREASRVVGNMAALYPDELDGAIDALLKTPLTAARLSAGAAPTRWRESLFWSVTRAADSLTRSEKSMRASRRAE